MSFLIRNIKSGLSAILGIASRGRVMGGPRTIALIISNECNSRCLMCWFRSPLLDGQSNASVDENLSLFMDHALCKTIISEVREMGTFRVVLGGFGEPTLHPRFEDILDFLIRLEMEPYVITSGLDVDRIRVNFWATKRAHFRFSLHAGDVETWLRIHPNGTTSQFENISKTIKLLVESDTASVSIMHVLQRANFRHVNDMIEHARELGVREVLFLPVQAVGKLAEVVLHPDEERELHDELKSCLQQAKSYNIRTNLRDYLSTNRYISGGVPQTTYLYRKIPCYIGWVYSEFYTDGTMRPCEYSEIVMGRAGDQRIRDMWLSDLYNSFRNNARNIPLNCKTVKKCLCNTCTMAKYNINIYNLLRLKSFKYWEA